MFYTICLLHSTQVLLPTGFHFTTLQGFTQVSPSKGALSNHLSTNEYYEEFYTIWTSFQGGKVSNEKTPQIQIIEDFILI